MFCIFSRILLILTTELLYDVSSETEGCPALWTEHNGLCYRKMPNRANYLNARCVCSKDGAILATLSTPDKTSFIDSFIRSSDDTIILGADRLRDDTFVWMDGTVVENLKWMRNQPDNFRDQEHCIVYAKDLSSIGQSKVLEKHEGVDVQCVYYGWFICERPIEDWKFRNRLWRLRERGVVYLDNILWEMSKRSRPECTVECSLHCKCYSFSFNPLTGRCVLYNTYFLRLSRINTQIETFSALYD